VRYHDSAPSTRRRRLPSSACCLLSCSVRGLIVWSRSDHRVKSDPWSLVRQSAVERNRLGCHPTGSSPWATIGPDGNGLIPTDRGGREWTSARVKLLPRILGPGREEVGA
jgi:hypothetical protein